MDGYPELDDPCHSLRAVKGSACYFVQGHLKKEVDAVILISSLAIAIQRDKTGVAGELSH